MEVEDPAQSSSSTSSEASFVSFNSEDNNAQQSVQQQQLTAAAEQSNNNETSTTVVENPTLSVADASQSSEPLPEVVLNSEEWHRSFPSVCLIQS